MKKASIIILSLMLILALSACGTSTEKYAKDGNPMSIDDSKKMFENPDSFKGQTVILTGKVFGTPEIQGDMVVFKMWHDTRNDEDSILIYYKDINRSLKAGDLVRIEGTVEGAFKIKDASGAELFGPKITASKLVGADLINLKDPPLKSIIPNKTIDQSGISLTVESVDFSKEETRIRIKLTNNSDAKYSLSSYSDTIIQNGQQFESKGASFFADYPEVVDNLLPGASSSGVLVFPVMQQSNFQLYMEGMSDSINIKDSPFVFDIEVN